jgi:hypothetical protein
LSGVDLGGIGSGAVAIAAILAGLLLVAYGYFSTIGLLRQGTANAPDKDPLASPVPVEIAAAAIGATVATGGAKDLDYEHVTGLIDKLVKPSTKQAVPEAFEAELAAANGQPKFVMLAEPEPQAPLAHRSALP